jgi:L-seryl-tRNA(Ser) seleniumtransferase
MRALRVDKLTLAALEATLRLARDAAHAVDRIPLWSMIATPVDELADRAEALAATLRAELGLDARSVPSAAYVGGGSLPVRAIRSAAVAVYPPYPTPGREGSEAAWAEALRLGDPPVVARVAEGGVLLDLRAVRRDQEPRLLDAIRAVCQDMGAMPPPGSGGNGPGASTAPVGVEIRPSGRKARA